MPTYDDAISDARQKLAAGDARGAFGALRWPLSYPAADLRESARWGEAFQLFAQIAAELAGEELSKLARGAVEAPQDAQAHFDLGYELIEAGLPEIAATVLLRAHELEPDTLLVTTELAAALEASGLNHEAVRLLKEAGPVVHESFVPRYSLAFNTLMTGNVREAQSLLPDASLIEEDDPHAETFRFMRVNLSAMLDRARAIRGASTLDDRDLRGWHYVVNGSVLLTLSPYGFDEGMQGRYAYMQDSSSNCLAGIRSVEGVLKAWGRRPECIFALPERGSTALALAAGSALAIPVEPWPLDGTDQPGLLVAYDLERLAPEVLDTVAQHRPGQILWSHITTWTHRSPVAADLTTSLVQINVAPWDERTRFVPGGEPTREPASTASPEDLARDIVGATVGEEELQGLPELIRFCVSVRALHGTGAPGAFQESGARRLFRTDSPVKSSRFL